MAGYGLVARAAALSFSALLNTVSKCASAGRRLRVLLMVRRKRLRLLQLPPAIWGATMTANVCGPGLCFHVHTPGVAVDRGHDRLHALTQSETASLQGMAETVAEENAVDVGAGVQLDAAPGEHARVQG